MYMCVYMYVCICMCVYQILNSKQCAIYIFPIDIFNIFDYQKVRRYPTISVDLSGSQWIYIQAGCLLGLGWGSLRRFWRWQRTSSQLRLAEERWGKFALVDEISSFFHAHFQYRILPRQDRQTRICVLLSSSPVPAASWWGQRWDPWWLSKGPGCVNRFTRRSPNHALHLSNSSNAFHASSTTPKHLRSALGQVGLKVQRHRMTQSLTQTNTNTCVWTW